MARLDPQATFHLSFDTLSKVYARNIRNQLVTKIESAREVYDDLEWTRDLIKEATEGISYVDAGIYFNLLRKGFSGRNITQKARWFMNTRPEGIYFVALVNVFNEVIGLDLPVSKRFDKAEEALERAAHGFRNLPRLLRAYALQELSGQDSFMRSCVLESNRLRNSILDS